MKAQVAKYMKAVNSVVALCKKTNDMVIGHVMMSNSRVAGERAAREEIRKKCYVRLRESWPPCGIV